jgi:lipopolysaccharide transport protein LptA
MFLGRERDMSGIVLRIEKVRIQWIKVWKSFIAVLFVTVLAVIAISLITHSKQQLKISQVSENSEVEMLEQKEQIEFFEARGQKGNLRIRADKHYLGDDDHYHLEGNVEIVFLEKSEGEDIFLYGDEVVYDKEGTKFQFVEKSQVKFKDLTIDVSSLEYDADDRMFKSEFPIRFTSERLSGSGSRMAYSLKNRDLVLDGDVHVELFSALSPVLPVVLEADKFSFAKRGKKGKLVGDVHLYHGKSWVTSDLLDFKLTANGENIRSMQFKNDVKAFVEKEDVDEEESPSSIPHKEGLPLYSDRREIQADEVFIEGFIDLSRIRQISSKGNCLFKFTSASGQMTQIKGNSVEFDLSSEGELVRFLSSKDAEVIEWDEGLEESRSLRGDTIALKDNGNTLVVKGKKNNKARVSTGDSDIKADKIRISRTNNNIDANGDVQVIFNAQKEGKQMVGFFSGNQPVFVTTQEMRYFAGQKRFHFKGGNKVWQDKDILFSDVLIIHKETGKVTAEGKISSAFSYVPKDKEDEERLLITAEKMSFDPERDIVHYQGKNTLEVKGIELTAQSVFIHLDNEGGDIKRITATEDVVITQEEYQGTGQRAIFDLKKETIVLTGEPVLIARDKGKTAGTKLTFYIADGKIVVENKSRERSVTVIKS